MLKKAKIRVVFQTKAQKLAGSRPAYPNQDPQGHFGKAGQCSYQPAGKFDAKEQRESSQQKQGEGGLEQFRKLFRKTRTMDQRPWDHWPHRATEHSGLVEPRRPLGCRQWSTSSEVHGVEVVLFIKKARPRAHEVDTRARVMSFVVSAYLNLMGFCT